MAERQNRRNRGPYNNVSNQDRNRIIDAFENDQDYIKVAETLGVKRQTARSIIIVFLHQGRHDAIPRRGYCPSEVDDEMRDSLQEILDNNPLLTFDTINTELRRRLLNKPTISRSTLARALDGMLLTLKLAEDIPEGQNDDRNLQQRVDCAQWFLRQSDLELYIH